MSEKNLEVVSSMLVKYAVWYKEMSIARLFSKAKLPNSLIRKLKYKDIDELDDKYVDMLIKGLNRCKVVAVSTLESFIKELEDGKGNTSTDRCTEGIKQGD